MFELVAILCAHGAMPDGPSGCTPRLVPGFEAEARAACDADRGRLEGMIAAGTLPGALDQLAAQAREGALTGLECRPAGPALALQEIAPGVLVHTGAVALPEDTGTPVGAHPDRLPGDTANLGVIIGEGRVAVIDAGGSRPVAEALYRAIRARTDLPIGYLVLTHVHPDHALGAEVFVQAGAQVAGHQGLARAMADRWANYLESYRALVPPETVAGLARPEITHPVAPGEAGLRLDLGGNSNGREVLLRAWPAAHSATDLTVFDPQTGTLFAGDLVFDDHVPALDGQLAGWQQVVERLSHEKVARLVPGHGAAVLDWPEGGADLRRYLARLEADTRAAIAAGARLSEALPAIAASEAGLWRLFDAFNPRNATQAFTELEWQ